MELSREFLVVAAGDRLDGLGEAEMRGVVDEDTEVLAEKVIVDPAAQRRTAGLM